MTASNEALRARPTPEQIETSLRRIGTGQVRRCIPVEPDDDDVVLSNAVEHLTADLAAARETLARVRGTVERLDRESAAIHLGELERNVAHYCIDALRSALLDAEPTQKTRASEDLRAAVPAAEPSIAAVCDGNRSLPPEVEEARIAYANACEAMGMAHADGTRAKWYETCHREEETRAALRSAMADALDARSKWGHDIHCNWVDSINKRFDAVKAAVAWKRAAKKWRREARNERETVASMALAIENLDGHAEMYRGRLARALRWLVASRARRVIEGER